MRALFLIAGAVLALGGCGHNDQTDKTQNVDENLSAESIVSNDVTAIDAVTGDAANMAADVDMNFGSELDANVSPVSTNETTAKPSTASRPKPSKPPQPATTANTVANSE